MRLRVGAVLCLFLAFWGAGCRKALAPTLDNQAPETWIVAAPQDTLTDRDQFNQPVKPAVGRIPVRFHLYWAGADRDGDVVGFYFAVVETLPIPAEGSSTVPSLPGPKARDYQFTTKRDSIFVFHASEEVNERQHAFYIYAVDNKGRADATPARFIFSSYDRFPPLAIVDELKAVGTIYQLLPAGGVTPVERTYFVRDSFEISDTHVAPRDTIPTNSLISVRWHGEPTTPSTIITGYRYKLDETTFNTADSSVHQVTYNTGVGLDKVAAGQKLFTLRAIGQSGWRGESTRWFQMNFAPDTWFSGPDPDDPLAGWQTHTDGHGKRYWYIDMSPVTGWAGFHGVPGTQLSADSANILPALRPASSKIHPEKLLKTFFEIYNDRLWLKQEGDTVDLNSWIVIPSGGFDRDSPYAVKVNLALLAPELKGLPVTTPGGPNGSPIGFRIRVQVKAGTDALNLPDQPSETTTYPVIDPASFFHQPVLNGYWGLTTAGKAYAVIRAEDGNGTVDRRVDRRPGGAVGIADRVDAGGGSDEDKALRSKILTFFVDKAVNLHRNDPNLVPAIAGGPTTFTSRSVILRIPADDVDFYDASQGGNKVGGSPTTYRPTIRRKIAIFGKLASDPTKNTCYVDPGVVNGGYPFEGPINFTIPDSIAAGNITVRVRLCDCQDCDDIGWPSTCPFLPAEQSPGEGRCVDTDIPAILQTAGPEPADIIRAKGATQRPGSSTEPGRRQP